MAEEAKKPEQGTTPETPAPGDHQAKNNEAEKTVAPTQSLTERARRHQDELKTSQDKAEAETKRHLSEAEELISELVPALEDKEHQLQEKERIEQTLRRENEILRKEKAESLEKYLEEKRQMLDKIQEDHATSARTIEDLRKEIKTHEEQLAAERAKTPEKEARQDSPGATRAVGAIVVLLVIIGVMGWALFSKSGPQNIVSTGGLPTTQTQNGAIKPILLTNSAVIKQYQEYTESHDPVRAFDPLLVGQLQVVSICEPEKNGLGFVLRHAIFEEGKIIAVSPPIDTYGDGRQQRGFSPCYVPTI